MGRLSDLWIYRRVFADLDLSRATGSHSVRTRSESTFAEPQQSTGDTVSTFYHSRYLLAGFLLRAARACEDDTWKRTVEASFKLLDTPELKALSHGDDLAQGGRHNLH
jgi:hypothetical protein